MSKNKLLLSAGLFVLVFAFVFASVPSNVFASAPTISSIAPAFGIVSGGTSITITGTGFLTTPTVTIGGASATSIVETGGTQITAVTPAGTAGAQNVVVTNTDAGTITSTGGFTYVVAPTAVNLGTAANYAVLAKTTVTTTGVTSVVGDVAVSPAAASFLTGFGQTMDSSGTFSTSSLVTGKLYAADYTSPTPATLTTAVGDMQTAYTSANAAATTVLDAGSCVSGTCNLGGLTLAPGVYTFNGAGNVNITSNLTLSGSTSDVWIFQLPGNLDISAATSILLSGGAVPAHIFWAVAGTSTLETTSTFEGNILAGPGSSTIAMKDGSTLNGRALGQTAVTLIGASIANPTTSSVTATSTTVAVAHTSTITYTLTAGTFSGTGGIVNGNWTLGGTNVADLGTISSVVLSSGNKVATVTVSGTVVIAHNYTITPAQAAFAAGFTAPAAATVTVNAKIISVSNITGIVAPVVGATPVTTAISGTGYTGTVSWSPNDATFGFATPYTATITLTPTDVGYTLTGVTVNQFSVAGARSTNSANSGVISAVFTTNMVQGGGGGQLNNGVSSQNNNNENNNNNNTTPPPMVTLNFTTLAPSPATISGCNNGTTGFSTVTGQSCSNNTTTITTTPPVNILGCYMGTAGYSTFSGISCAGNTGTTTVTTSYNLGTVTLKDGSNGNAVKQLQMFLNKNLNISLVVDGLLGPKTIAIVKQWQKAHGLVADGLVGTKTKAAMNATQ